MSNLFSQIEGDDIKFPDAKINQGGPLPCTSNPAVFIHKYTSDDTAFLVALSGKIRGGIKDDVATALKLGDYFTELDVRNYLNEDDVATALQLGVYFTELDVRNGVNVK
jgi:hypothetical protein